MSKVEPVRKSVTVATSIERAFAVFTDGIDGWWPRTHHIGKTPMVKSVIEPRVGGRWFATHEDGSETDTGVVVAYEPPHRVVLTWQLDADWKYDPHFRTEVEVVFTAEADKRTRVDLTHRGLEAYGVKSEKLRSELDADNAWAGILESFAKESIT